MKMLRESGSVILQHEIECTAEDTVRFSAHTSAFIRLSGDGKAAILDIGGTKMYVSLLGDGVFDIRAAAPDAYSPIPGPAPSASSDTPKPQAVNEGFQKLEVHLKGKDAYRIAVWFYPLAEGEELPKEKPAVKPLAVW
jgi:hypothetical protein